MPFPVKPTRIRCDFLTYFAYAFSSKADQNSLRLFDLLCICLFQQSRPEFVATFWLHVDESAAAVHREIVVNDNVYPLPELPESEVEDARVFIVFGPFLFLHVRDNLKYAILQLQIVCSDLHLVTYLDVGNFCDKSTELRLLIHDICVQVFLRFSDSRKPSQSVSLIYELAWLAGIRKSEENLLKTSCNVVSVNKVAHMFWWRQDNWKQSASAHEHWCDVSWDILY